MTELKFDWGPLLKGGPFFVGSLNLSESPLAMSGTSRTLPWGEYVD